MRRGQSLYKCMTIVMAVLIVFVIMDMRRIGGLLTKLTSYSDKFSQKTSIVSNTRTKVMKADNSFQFSGKVHVISKLEDGQWKERQDMCDVRPEFVKARLGKPADTPIYVYDRATDEYVSGSIIRYGMWEGDLVNNIRKYLSEDSERVLLDLGSNVGVFSLMAAKFGRRVFAVDCLLGNVQRLCASAKAGHFSDQVTIIYNALSDVRGNVTFGTYKGNVGGTFVKPLTKDNPPREQNKIIRAILLDDLLDIFKYKKVVIKMDLETFEEKALKGAERFLSEIQVDYIVMEFGWHRGRPSARSIINILDRHKMAPMLPSVHSVQNLTDVNIKSWPAYVTWKRKGI